MNADMIPSLAARSGSLHALRHHLKLTGSTVIKLAGQAQLIVCTSS